MSEPITTRMIESLLAKRFEDWNHYAVAWEVGNSTGYARRRLDMVVVDVWPSSGFSVEGIEIKVSKSDLKNDLKDPSKHNIFYPDLDFFSLAAPADIIDMDILPKHWGVYKAYYDKNGELKLRCARQPIHLHDQGTTHVSRSFFASLVRHIFRSRPSESMLKEKYKEGYDKGYESGKREILARSDNAVKELESLKADKKMVDDILFRLGIYTEDEKERKLSQFERFRKASWSLNRLDGMIESLNVLRDIMKEDGD